MAARGAWGSLDADGTGCLRVTARASAVAAAMDRINTIARNARAGGDSRTLAQLRSDAAMAYLLAGTLPAQPDPEPAPSPTSPGTDDQDDQDDQDQDNGGQAEDSQDTGGQDSGGQDEDSQDGASHSEAGGSGSAGGGGPGGADRLWPAAGGGWEPAGLDWLSAVLAGCAPAVVEVVVPLDVLTGADPEGVGLVTGHGHLSGEHAREVVLTPGSTLYRLVTDPASGHLVDRSVGRYRPDELMRAVLIAADVYCRGPGCMVPARDSQIDHVTNYPQGPTALSNLGPEHPGHHGVKTNKWWQALIDPSTRVITWSTFFDRVYTTTPFDYRTLTGNHNDNGPGNGPGNSGGDGSHGSGPGSSGDGSGGRSGGGSGGDGEGGLVWADLQDQLVYAALSERAGYTTLGRAEDEEPDPHPWAPRPPDARQDRRRDPAREPDQQSEPEFERDFGRGGLLELTHTTNGQTRRGTPPKQPTSTALLNRLIGPGTHHTHQDHHHQDDQTGDPPPPF